MNKNRNMQVKFKRKIKWIVSGICVIVLAYFISKYWYQFALIQGDSMSPAYHDKQLVLLDKHSRDFSVGDVIAFRCEGVDANLIKRIVAEPGDTVIIMNRKLYVNGICRNDECIEYAGIAEEKIVLQTGQYFVMGDNTAVSKDSRYQEIGLINERDIIGKVL